MHLQTPLLISLSSFLLAFFDRIFHYSEKDTKTVSRLHATLVWDQLRKVYRLTCNGRNGVLINGRHPVRMNDKFDLDQECILSLGGAGSKVELQTSYSPPQKQPPSSSS